MTEIPELLERFRRGGELLAAVTTGCAGAELDFRPEPTRWSVRQIACHLADSEQVASVRFRQTIAEDHPTLIRYDEKLWAERLDYTRRRISVAVETFRRTRAENYDLLKALPPESFTRTATHAELGVQSLLDLLRTYAEHVENHVVQIRTLRLAYKATRESRT